MECLSRLSLSLRKNDNSLGPTIFEQPNSQPFHAFHTFHAPGLQPIIPTNAAKNRPKMVVNL